MKISHRVALVASVALLGAAGLVAPAHATNAAHPPNNNKAEFFVGGDGTAGWVNSDGGKVAQLSSPDGGSYAGFQGRGIDGVNVAGITALSYDFRVTTPGWTGGGGGSPRLVVEFSDGGDIALTPVTSLTSGQWVHMDAITGAVDSSGGTCGYRYQATWTDAAACHSGTTVVEAFVVNDSGWLAPLTLQVDNVTLNTSVYSGPGSAKK